ncbi:MAG: hypothetical protein JSS32_10370 [Verrucomicrobia bacterium]|nr:hypothetical protein [Verrucomicrobiota bacterium]
MDFSYFKNRKLRVDILTIFLFLISLSSLMIITFTHTRLSKSFFRFSTDVIERASELIIERITGLVQSSEHMADEASSLMLKPEDFSFQNEELVSYMLRLVKDHPNLYGIYYGRPDGSLLEVVNLAAAYQTNFIFNPTQPLPPESAYVLRFIDRTQNQVSDQWYYKDKNLKTIASESLNNPISNPTTRPWYQGAVSTKEIFWTPVYPFDPLGEPGITVSKASYDSEGKLVAVVGVDISLNLFSHFLTGQKIGKSGQAFVLNTSGEVIIPEKLPPGISKDIIDTAYSHYVSHKSQDFIFMKHEVEFLASAHTFPVTGTFNWVTLIIAPLNDFMGDLFKTQKEVVVISLVILILASLLVVYFSKRISVPIVTLANETERIRHLDLKSETRVQSNIHEIKLMDSSIAAMRVAIRSFSRYIPVEIVKQLIEKGEEIAIGGQRIETTIFFSDIEGFTSIAETYDTEKLLALLSEYFDDLSKIIQGNQGIIDKFIGDGIMAIWGAPKQVSDHAILGCKAALECQALISQLNDRLEKEGKPVFKTRIGIDAGEVIAGNVGTPERMNYTAMGNTVNTAARLQGTNKIYKTKILISERVREKIGDHFLVRPLDIVELKGKKEKTKIYELMDPLRPNGRELSVLFTRAFDLFEKQDLAGAKALFLEIQQKFPDDVPTQMYLERLLPTR